MRKIVRCGLVALAVSGCASNPPVTMSYYPPAAATDLKVIQTVGCDADRRNFVIGYAVTSTTTYFRHPRAQPHSFQLASLGSDWADASGTFAFTEDGRLRSVNTSSTGQGEAVVKAGTAMLSTALGMALVSPCDAVAAAGKDGVVSLIYTGRIDHNPETASGAASLAPDAASAAIRRQIGSTLPTPQITIDAGSRNVPPVQLPQGSPTDDLVMLTLNHTLTRTLAVRESGTPAPFWTATVVAPEAATYTLPVPRAAIFGKRTFALTLADSGRPTSAGYEATSGAAGVLIAAGTIATALSADSITVRAAETKAEADLIAQQQRLVRCRANPGACI